MKRTARESRSARERTSAVGAPPTPRCRRASGTGSTTTSGGPSATARVPVVAALHGHVLGRGLDIALAADIRVAAENTRLGFPEVRHGMTIGGGGLRRLVRAIGESRAMDLLLCGESIDAATAREWGLVTRVVPNERPEGEAQRLAAHLDALPRAGSRRAASAGRAHSTNYSATAGSSR
ncbi:enoyl-CoA hydratase/isomerase family protein [Streptomyces sp. NPDC059909]|uniref:enoyl-CoA hydratase/isomerase family protein n=1 Tax=Streptomyces sp. NPDC059909 TaxID=3346998 RepID=UPI00366A07C9